MLLFDVRCHALPLRCTCNNDNNEAVIGGAEGAGRFCGEGMKGSGSSRSHSALAELSTVESHFKCTESAQRKKLHFFGVLRIFSPVKYVN